MVSRSNQFVRKEGHRKLGSNADNLRGSASEVEWWITLCAPLEI